MFWFILLFNLRLLIDLYNRNEDNKFVNIKNHANDRYKILNYYSDFTVYKDKFNFTTVNQSNNPITFSGSLDFEFGDLTYNEQTLEYNYSGSNLKIDGVGLNEPNGLLKLKDNGRIPDGTYIPLEFITVDNLDENIELQLSGGIYYNIDGLVSSLLLKSPTNDDRYINSGVRSYIKFQAAIDNLFIEFPINAKLLNKLPTFIANNTYLIDVLNNNYFISHLISVYAENYTIPSGVTIDCEAGETFNNFS